MSDRAWMSAAGSIMFMATAALIVSSLMSRVDLVDLRQRVEALEATPPTTTIPTPTRTVRNHKSGKHFVR